MVKGQGVKPQTKIKKNYKVSPVCFLEITGLITSGHTNDYIRNHIASKFGVSITNSRVSQIRRKVYTQEIAYYNKDLEKKIKKKVGIAKDMLDIIGKSYKLINQYMTQLDSVTSMKDIVMINSVVANIHRLYNELLGMKEKSDIDYNIQKALE